MQFTINIEKILEYDDLFYGQPFDVDTTLRKYSRELIVNLVNCLSLTYEKAFIPDKDNPFFSNPTPKVNTIDYKLSRFLRDAGKESIYYCAPRSILELLRRTFAIPADDYSYSSNLYDFEYDIFLVLLKINQDLMHFSMESEKEDIATLTFLLNYILNDVTNADWKRTLQTQIYYIDNLCSFLSYSGDASIILKNFCKKVGISSIKEYLQTVLSLIAIYINQKKANSRACPRLCLESIDDQTGFLHKEVCDYLSLDIKAYISSDSIDYTRDNNVDYREFRSHPLIKIEDGCYIIYSLPLLCERLYNSLFFDFKEFYNGNFFSFYNKEFIEHFLFQRTMLSCIGKSVSHYYPNKDMITSMSPISEGANAPDFYIRENDSIIIFECKGIKINGEIKDKADVDDFIHVLKEKLLLATENTDKTRSPKRKAEHVGITQIVRTIEIIEDDEFGYDKNIPLEVSYYPVIVFEDIKLAQMGMSGLLNKWYNQVLIERGLTDAVCNHLIVMSISTLYLYADKFRIFGFLKIFDDFLFGNMKQTRGEDNALSPLADFDWYMQRRYKISKQIQNDYQKLVYKIRSDKGKVQKIYV